MDAVPIALPVYGLIAGMVLGYIARRNFFCTLSALEQHWYGENSDGLRIWVFAAVVAAVFTQSAVALGIADTSESFYLSPSFGLPAAIIGGLSFGFGMALVGTCGYGALVRLGGGSLKSLMAVLILGLTALSTQRGLLAFSRTELLDPLQIDFQFAGDQSLPSIINALTGLNLTLVSTIAVIALPAIWVLKNKNFRSNRQALLTGVIVGAVVTFGWIATSYLALQSFVPVQVESASFIAPVSDTILQFAAFTGTTPDYGVGLVVGTVTGAALAARRADNVRWEACDDAAELGRHIAGAAMMGFGGVLALGCTIGQGISAASLLTVSAPVTMLAIGLGARMGLAWLVEGSALAPFRRFN